jgi:hypothetical protein
MKRLLLLLILCGLLALTSAVDAEEPRKPPDGWRYPTEKELADQERSKSSTKLARAFADFNGDRVPDEAYLFKSTKFSGQGLLVWLSDDKGGFRWVTLDVIDWGPNYSNVDLAMGLDLLTPGTYQYLCIEVAKDCIGKTEPRSKMMVKNPSVLYYRFESAASLFYWDSDKKRFVRVWLSD